MALGQSYLDSIQAQDLKEYVTFLASDEMKGRQTPSPELDKAAAYIAGEFKKDGVLPGNEGSYYQIVEWTRGKGAGQLAVSYTHLTLPTTPYV